MTNPNDSATGFFIPGYEKAGWLPESEKGFTKYEEAHLRFMCAISGGIYSNPDAYVSFIKGADVAKFKGTVSEYVANNATALTKMHTLMN